LEKHVIVPDTVMNEEIQYRIQCWLEDTQGRRDFAHRLNVELNKWGKERKQLMLAASAAAAASSTGGGGGASAARPLRRITTEEVQEAKKSLAAKLVGEKVEELRAAERTTAAITKELFWKYQKECRDRNYNEENKPYPVHVKVSMLLQTSGLMASNVRVMCNRLLVVYTSNDAKEQ
jgi:hypothetical protein